MSAVVIVIASARRREPYTRAPDIQDIILAMVQGRGTLECLRVALGQRWLDRWRKSDFKCQGVG